MCETKICGKCNIEKKLSYFNYRNDTKKYRNFCKKCTKGYETSLEERRELTLSLFNKGLKECSKCRNIKSVSEFSIDINTLTKLSSNCRECIKNKYTKTELRNLALITKYKISIEDYNNILKKQGGKCAICKINSDKLVVDHCHDSLKIRGILCTTCNSGLGFFKDSLFNLSEASKYLIKTNTNK